MKKVIFDCDNTMGVHNCDVDDGLALMYLLGCENVHLLGITTTYGNHKLDVVWKTTKRMLKDLKRTDLVVKRGGEKAGDSQNDASDYLVKMANKYQGALSILATGSLTNLMGAYQKDGDFFEKVKEIVLMGGITVPLSFEKRSMDELNFSCDPFATYTVLTKGKNVSVITGNNCLKVLFQKDEYKQLFHTGNKAAEYIRKNTNYYFGYNEESYGIQGFYNWDVTAAVYLVHPELFSDDAKKFQLSIEDLKRGYLRELAGGKTILNLPMIDEVEKFKKNIYDTWMKIPMD